VPVGRSSKLIGAAVVVAFAIAALTLAAVLNIWVDESFSLNTTSGSVAQAYRRAIVFEWQAPFYFVVLDVWRHLSPAVWFARVASCFCAVGTLLMVPGLARRYAPGVAPLLPLMAFAAAPFLLWAALEIRPYPLVVVLSAVFVRALYDEFLSPTPRPRIGVALSGAALVLTHYFAGAIVVGGAAAVITGAGLSSIRRYLVSCLIMAVALIPLAFVLPMQIGAFHEATPRDGQVGVARQLLDTLARFSVPIDWTVTARYSAIILGAAFLAYFLVRRTQRPERSSPVFALLALVAVTYTTIWLMTLLAGTSIVLPRYAAVAFVPTVLLPFAAFSELSFSVRRYFIVGWVVCIVVFGLVSMIETYKPLAKPGDWTRVAAYLERVDTGQVPIVVFKADDALALEASFNGTARVVPMPRPLALDRPWSLEALRLGDRSSVAGFLRSAAGKQGRIWLVSTDVCQWLGFDYGCDRLESVIKSDWTVERDQAFFHSRVRLLVHN
jgi:hypothetical protein